VFNIGVEFSRFFIKNLGNGSVTSLKTKLIIILSLVLATVLLIAGISYAVSPEEQAKICAQESLPSYLESIRDIHKEFHFSSQEDLTKARLGEPIHYVRIGLDEFAATKTLKHQTQPFPFYLFPVVVDGKAVTDFTVVLENGKWQPVTIGGNMSTIIEDMATQNELASGSSVILIFAGQTFVITNKDGQEYGYLPYSYLDDQEMGVEAKKLIPSKDFRDFLKKKADARIEQAMRAEDSDEIISGGIPEAPLLFFEQESVWTRLARYLSYRF
jgi:hypothetical protein